MEKIIKSEDSMGQFLQKQPHRLTMARHNLGIHQLRIMARIVEKLQPDMNLEVNHEKYEEDIVVKIDVAELVVSGNVKPLREALEGLMRKVVCIMHYLPEKATHLEIGTTLIHGYKYEHGDGKVRIQISKDLLPQFVSLAKGYTRYSLQVAFNTSSPNVFKLYQFISHFRDKPQVQCSIDTLRKWLQIEHKYTEPRYIKHWILEPAMQELKEKADVWFDIASRMKDGRRMVGWNFNIYTKEIRERENPIAPKDPELELKLCNKYGLGKVQASKIITWIGINQEKMRGLKKALYDIQLMMLDKRVQNIGGYTTKVLSEKLGIKF